MNECIDNFSTTLCDLVLPYCNVSCGPRVQSHNIKKREPDKPWFNEICKNRYTEYKTAVHSFNLCKSTQNHEILLHKKSLYKKTARQLKRNYDRHQGNNIEYLRKHNPKQFYKHFSKRKKKSIDTNITSDQFLHYFKQLADADNDSIDSSDVFDDVQNTVYEELDVTITEEEISKAIGRLKSNKSSAEDNIINEMFMKCRDVMTPLLCRLFNEIYNSGFFPESWSKGCIVSIYKKGDKNDPNNYRGITIVSCLGKLFTSVLNNRLLEWDKTHNIITDAQFGFKSGSSTTDAIFVLQSLINRTLRRKKRLYCCFVDYQKAFDFIDRTSLWTKLIKLGIHGKMFGIIKSLYENVKSCIKHNGFLTQHFTTTSGLLQGEIMSPILFSLYVNDFEMYFLSQNCPSIELQLINIFLLMYADDTVLISETPDGLQNMLDKLYEYTQEWNLTVNINKTKIMVFRNNGKLRNNEKWTYDGQSLEIVESFNYLGMLFHFNGKFLKTQKHFAEQGRKALFAINSTLKSFQFNIETQLSVFDTYINSILSYAGEIWGFHKALDVERVHTAFCKRILGVKKNCCNNLVYCELGRFPLSIIRKIKIFKYWAKLKSTTNCILKACYEEMIETNDDWIVNIRNELNTLGLAELFYSEVCDKSTIDMIVQRVKDIYKQTLLSNIATSAKGVLYQHLVDNFTLQYYLCKPINPMYMKYIARFRTSTHDLNVERGRYENIDRRNRTCMFCNLNDLDDEFHFILKCPHFFTLRKKYIKEFYYKKPSVFKLIKLLSVNNVSELCNLGKFLYLACKKRSET